MPEQEATTQLESPLSGPATDATAPQPVVGGANPALLVPLAEAAALAFLGLLTLGAILLVTVKLQYPNLGVGADLVDVLSGVVILALATLRVPIHLGELTFTVLPLGTLLALFFIVRWACRVAAPSAPPRRAPLVGMLFGAMALLAALVFRFRFEPDALYAGAPGAAGLGFIWVSLFAALAFAGSRQPLAKLAGRRLGGLRDATPALFEGVRAGALMLLFVSVLGSAAALLSSIFLLAVGEGPHDLDTGDLIAALVYVAIFAPNLVVTLVALSLGAPVEVGAGLTVHGEVRGNLDRWSVFGDGNVLALLLLLVPLVACAAAGYWARRNTERRERVVRILASAAFVFAAVLALLGWLGEARLGAELASSRGFAAVAPRAPIVFLLGLLWAAGAGYAGWMLADRNERE